MGSLKYVTTPEVEQQKPLKNGGWKMILSYWVPVTFQGRTVKLREGRWKIKTNMCFFFLCVLFFSYKKQIERHH